MNRNILFKLGLSGLALMLGCATVPTKKSILADEPILSDSAAQSSIFISTDLEGEQSSVKFFNQCNAVVLDDIVLTAAHCHTKASNGKKLITNTYTRRLPNLLENSNVSDYATESAAPANILPGDTESDLALVKTKAHLPQTGIPLAEKLNVGDEVFYYPLGKRMIYEFSSSYWLTAMFPSSIRQTSVGLEIRGKITQNFKGEYCADLMQSLPGFSGSGVFTKKEGKVYLAGVVLSQESPYTTELPFAYRTCFAGPERIREFLTNHQ